MNRVLFVATVDEHIRHFHLPFLKWFHDRGYEVHVAANGTEQLCYCDIKHNLNFQRTPFSSDNWSASRQLKHLLKQYKFELIHFHTPVASVFGRYASRQTRKDGTSVLYTAHGFHFFKGAPLKNWLFFYPAERFMARYTDGLLVINQEDYQRAVKFPAAKSVHLVHGIGVDLGRFSQGLNRTAAREQLSIPADAVVILSVGELSARKNHRLMLKALSKIDTSNMVCLIAGQGSEQQHLVDLSVELGIADNVRLLGYTTDTTTLYAASDIFCFPSLQEGLPVALMEAMACGLPCVASKIRGNSDLISEGQNGILFTPHDEDGCVRGLKTLASDDGLRQQMGQAAAQSVAAYGLENVLNEMTNIYVSFLKEGH